MKETGNESEVVLFWDEKKTAVGHSQTLNPNCIDFFQKLLPNLPPNPLHLPPNPLVEMWIL